MPVVLLDEITHEYTVDSRPTMGVTKAIGLGGCMGPMWADRWYADRGTAIHLATEYDDLGVLDEESVDPAVKGFLAGWRKFKREARPVFRMIEHKFFESLYGYCGTVDRVVSMGGLDGVLDIKGGGPEPWHALQLAGYGFAMERAIEAAGSGPARPHRRWGCYLTENGNYSLKEYAKKADYATFLGALAVAKWKRQHGLEDEDGR